MKMKNALVIGLLFTSMAFAQTNIILTGSGTVTGPANTIADLRALSVTSIPNNAQILVAGYNSPGDGGGGIFIYNSSSVATDNSGTIIAPSVGSGRWIRAFSGPIEEKYFGAKVDGSTDDSTAFQAAITYAESIGGGAVHISSGTTKTTVDMNITEANLTIYGDGPSSIVSFQPTVPASNHVAFAVYTPGGGPTGNVSGTIPIGATTFTTAATPTGVNIGDWIDISEKDPGIGDLVIIDYAQVSNISGTTITVSYPFRTAFPGTHSTPIWVDLGQAANNNVLRDFQIVTTDTSDSLIGIYCYASRNTNITRVTSAPVRGNAFASDGAEGLSILQCNQIKDHVQASEFSATVDLRVTGSFFSNDTPTLATGSSLVLDYGTAFFSVSGNNFGPAGNIQMQITYGVHDGTVSNNSFGYVYNAGIGTTAQIEALGAQRVAIVGNSFASGDLPCTALEFLNTSGLTVNINTSGNFIASNTFAAGITHFGTINSSDTYIDGNGGSITLGQTSSFPGTLYSVDYFRQSAVTNSEAWQATAATSTNAILGVLQNGSGDNTWGAESSAAGATFTGSTAYAAIFGTQHNQPVQIASHGLVDISITSAGVTTTLAGATLNVKSGTNAKAGTFALSSGLATVANTSVTSNSVIFCSIKTASGTPGLYAPLITINAGVGFTVTGASTDNSTYNFAIVEVN